MDVPTEYVAHWFIIADMWDLQFHVHGSTIDELPSTRPCVLQHRLQALAGIVADAENDATREGTVGLTYGSISVPKAVDKPPSTGSTKR